MSAEPVAGGVDGAAGGIDWIFASGSLIWRPGFDSPERRAALLPGFARRFWQASHDHRGTPDAPGRVVTLVPDAGASCAGVAWRIPSASRGALLDVLDVRERDGYERVGVDVLLDGRTPARAVTWIASAGNPSWVGDAPEDELAALIATRRGPSGANADYLFDLADALRALGVVDDHVHGLERRVRALLGG